MRHFLRNEFRITVDLSVVESQLSQTIKLLGDGLATWVPRITAPSGIFKIQATAGSGKTQLAMRLLHDAALHKKSILYVCFNRTLSDHIARIAPPRSEIANFHELCVDHFRRVHGEPDFTRQSIHDEVAAAFLEH